MTPSYLLNHYDVEETEYGYSFITDSRITYFLTFIAYPAVSDFLILTIILIMEERKVIYLCLAHLSEEGMEQKYVKEAFDTNWVVLWDRM